MVRASTAAVAAAWAARAAAQDAPIIDIHQHVGYSGRPDDVLLAHQRAMGVTRTILLPSGRPATRPSTHDGTSNAEQKFGLACDAPEMHAIYRLAEERRVPVLMHWQYGRYNHGFERFGAVLKQYPRVTFIGHAQTWWANIDLRHADQTVLYPKGPVTKGGLTDRYLSDYPNMFGDLSAGSGLNALTRDEAFTREFLERHQDKLLYGSDCNDHVGSGPACQGAQTIAAIRKLAASMAIERKLLHDNAQKMFRL